MQATGQIYLISIDEVNYIGQSIGSSLSRWSSHLRLLKANKHHCRILQDKFNEKGITSVTFKIIKDNIPNENLNYEENLNTNLYNSINNYVGNYIKIEKKKLILDDILAKVPYRKIAEKHNVSLGLISKIKSIYS